MTDKQQIEEMTIAEMVASYLDCNNIKVSNQLLPLHIEDIILKAGYRKVPEDAVVLTEEEYNALLAKLERYKNKKAWAVTKEVCEEYRKETVKEIFTKLIEVAKNNDNKLSIGLLKAWAIEYGVEVEE